MAGYRLDQLLSSFPWWAPLLAVVGLVAGIWLIRRYDFSYKINFRVVIILFIVVVITTGWFIDLMGLDNILFRRGPMQGIMRQYIQDNNAQLGPGWRR